MLTAGELLNGSKLRLCFFVGLTRPQAAKELGVSLGTVERCWAFASACLFREI